ncbi:MAG TPA: hypothetical protein PLR76_11490 [Hyphomonas sp.]|nr:hypothetical protein [Hyphomonas sp.]MCA8904602.1 hypothetical protein [Hyphomonas sp.]MCB9972205.1 hypothetical protein [Hyphomonas sp.]HPE49016.1 hypothetical protein [Hyphomonas sp.]
MAHGNSGTERGATPSTRAVALAALVVAIGLLGWRGMDVLTRAPASPGPLSQAETSLLSVAEAIAGPGHVRVSVARRAGGGRQVLVLLDEAAGLDADTVTRVMTAAAAIDAAKGDTVDLQSVSFAPAMTGAPTPSDWTELSLLALLAGLAAWLGFAPVRTAPAPVELVRETLPTRMPAAAPSARPAPTAPRAQDAADLARRDPARAADIVRGWMGKPGDAA